MGKGIYMSKKTIYLSVLHWRNEDVSKSEDTDKAFSTKKLLEQHYITKGFTLDEYGTIFKEYENKESPGIGSVGRMGALCIVRIWEIEYITNTGTR